MDVLEQPLPDEDNLSKIKVTIESPLEIVEYKNKYYPEISLE